MGRPKEDFDINGQFYFAGLAGFGWSVLPFKIAAEPGAMGRSRRHWDCVRARTVKSNSIKSQRSTKRKWQSKGIAKVLYETDGRKNKIVLDDCNYVRLTPPTRSSATSKPPIGPDTKSLTVSPSPH